MEDHKIIDLYWARSQQAIVESDQKYGPYCRAIALGILVMREDAEECVNDTWLRAWNAMPPQRPSVLSAFFGKLTRNLSLDDCLPDCRVPDQELDARETADLISTFLRTQPELDRRLFVRRYFHLEALSSLGKRFGLTESQVKSRLYRTRQKLKLLLEHEGVAI